MKLTRKIVIAILVGFALFGAASAASGATHASAAGLVEYA